MDKSADANKCLLLSLFFLFLFAIVFLLVIFSPSFLRIDVLIGDYLANILPLPLNLWLFFSFLADTAFIIAISVIFCAFLMSRKKNLLAFFVITSIGSGLLLTYLIKLLVQRPRPLGGLVDVVGYSFPSGHAVRAILFASLFMYVFLPLISSRFWRRTFTILNFSFVILIGLSRIFLKAHWFSDVLAGYFLGLFWIFLCVGIFLHFCCNQRNLFK